MSAPVNNSFWQLRSKHGRDRIFETPQEMWEAAAEYFNTVDKNPWYKNEAIKSGDACGEIIKIPTQRPYTLGGLQIFIGCTDQTWINYRSRQGFLEVMEEIEKVIRTQKFEGAAVGAFNANIIARDLGLKEQTESKNINYNSEPLSPDKIKEINKALEDGY